jgi:hypothetical protein
MRHTRFDQWLTDEERFRDMGRYIPREAWDEEHYNCDCGYCGELFDSLKEDDTICPQCMIIYLTEHQEDNDDHYYGPTDLEFLDPVDENGAP